jgi:hypothetical protein
MASMYSILFLCVNPISVILILNSSFQFINQYHCPIKVVFHKKAS